MTKSTQRLFGRAGERASARPTYLGWVLRRYMEMEGLDWDALAEILGASVGFSTLALCLRPRPNHFASDVRAIATKFGLHAAALANIVRMVDAAETLRAGEPTEASGTLIAARSRPSREHEREDPDD